MSAPPSTCVRDDLVIDQLATHHAAVRAVRDLGPGLRELTVGGGDLTSWSPCGPDDFVYVITGGLRGGPLRPDLDMAAVMAAAEAERPAAAYYTVRRWRPQVAELDLWVVLHSREHGASGWAARARPGTPVALWGPRSAFAPPGGTTHLLLAGDETALPAIGAILDHRDPALRVTVVAEVADGAHVVDLPGGEGIEVRWLFRQGEPAGTGRRLQDAVAATELPTDGLYAYVAAEHAVTADVRRHLRAERGLAAAQVDAIAYWRRG